MDSEPVVVQVPPPPEIADAIKQEEAGQAVDGEVTSVLQGEPKSAKEIEI